MLIDSCNAQRLLFDFDIAIGDSIAVDGINQVVIAIGDTILNDNKIRKTYATSNPGFTPDTELFIEGIGSQSTGLDHTGLISGYSTFLSCVNDSQGEIMLSPFANPIICERFSRITTSTQNIDIDTQISIYPNPTQGTVKIKNDARSPYLLKVLTLRGEVVLTENISTETADIALDKQPSGIYYFLIYNNENDAISVNKIIKL